MSNRPSREIIIELAKLDPEAIADLVLSLFDIAEQRDQEIAKLTDEIAELKRNSRNSSKPPSSDRSNKPPRSQRQRGKRSPGGQEGHQGHHLELSENPDDIIVHSLTGKCDCGCDLSAVQVLDHEVRQVFDL